MFLLLPVSHEDAVVRRMPWVSLGILAVCIALQGHACAVMPGLERRAEEIQEEMERVESAAVLEHYRKQSPADRKKQHDRLIEKLASGGSEREQSRVLEELELAAPAKFRRGELTAPDDPRLVRYRELATELAALKRKVPVLRFGYRPAIDGLGSILSSMFAHGGWLHLIGNMWFLCLVGCNLEDRWGRWQFLLFYVAAGVIAALTFTALHPSSSTALVGASGAVAGAMGAFMFCFARTKVKIFYAYMLMLTPRWGTFSASAWIVLAFWVGQELLMTLIESGAGGVAHSAHAGGFLYGASVAFLLKHLGVDAQLDEASERAADAAVTVFQEHPLYVRALRERDERRDAEALQTLIQLTEEAPDHQGAHELLFTIGLQDGDLRCVDLGWPVVLDQHQRAGAHEAMLDAFRELRRAFPDYGLTDKELFRIANAAFRVGDGALVQRALGELEQQYPQSPWLPRARRLVRSEAERTEAQVS